MEKIRLNGDCGLSEEIIHKVAVSSFCRGEILYRGRNEVRLFNVGEKKIVVKKFARCGTLRKLTRLFRQSKACNAFRNAGELLRRGIDTPWPIAYIEICNRIRLVETSFYVCLYNDGTDLGSGLNEESDFNLQLTVAFAHYAAELHKKGILHKDLNLTNVLYHQDKNKYLFTLIDINRMRFLPVDKYPCDKDCMENLTRFSCHSPMFRRFASEYALARGWNEQQLKLLDKAKTSHDRHVDRMKFIKRALGIKNKEKPQP